MYQFEERNLCLELAKMLHNGQTRTDGSPYVNHPRRVADIVEIHGGSDEQIYAALLHDTIEDCSIAPENLEFFVGKEITGLVCELTNIVPKNCKFEVKQAQLVGHCRVMSDEAKLIKLADRLDNLTDACRCWELWQAQRYARAGLEIVEAMRPLPQKCEPLAQEVIDLANKILEYKI